MLSRPLTAVVVMGMLLLALPIRAQETKLLPSDDSASDPEFKKAYDKLLKVIADRDAKALLKFLAPDVCLSFGGMYGVQDFKEMWNPADRNSEVWDELNTILRLGVVRSGDGPDAYFSAPYSFARFPDEYDAFDYGAIISKDAPVHVQPDAKEEVLFRLSYDIVKLIEWISDSERPECQTCGWYKIETLDGRSGFVTRKDARSPIEYRVIFQLRNDRWRITSFIAGD